METPTILGISFSTRQTGLAVFTSSLVDYSLSLYKERWSSHKRDMILASLGACIRKHYIKHIALSIPEDYHQTKQFKELLSTIITFATMNNIPYTSYPVSEVYRTLGSPIRRTRASLMKRLVMFYPELEIYQQREGRNRNKYYIKLFEAVAVAAHHWVEKQRK